MYQDELPKRIWNLDAETLIELGADAESIRAHAEIELDEDLDSLNKLNIAKFSIDANALEDKIRARHRALWANYSQA